MSFEDREKAFEDNFQHSEELRFKAEMRRDRLFGLWIAEQLGKSGDDAENYALSLVNEDLKEPGPQDMLERVRKDLDNKGVELSDHRLDKKLTECFSEAVRQLREG